MIDSLSQRLVPEELWVLVEPLIPPVTVPTAHRTFTEWTEAGLWRQLHHAVLDELGSQGLID